MTADYSQVELRLLAHFSGDENLTRAFAEGRDVHETVAAQIFKVPPEQVSAAQRRVAKTVNFGVIYGMSATGLAVLVLGMVVGFVLIGLFGVAIAAFAFGLGPVALLNSLAAKRKRQAECKGERFCFHDAV